MVLAVRPPRRWGPAVAVLFASALITGCATGVRATLRPENTAVGNAAVDAVLGRVLGLSDAVYTAEYESVVAFDGASTLVTATQAAPTRHSLTVGDIRYVVDGQRVETCRLEDDRCEYGHDAALISDTLLAPDFFYSNVASRLRRDAGLAIGPPVASTEDFEGRTATCVTIPLAAALSAPDSEPSSTYCVLDDGVLTRLASSDLQVTMTSYSDEADPGQLDP